MSLSLKIINQEIENYKQLIFSKWSQEQYKWEALKNFQENWDIEAADFKAMYDKSLYSKVSSNLWANPHWFPKSVMLQFIEYDQERVRQMFADLYNENDNIDKRIDRFVSHCDKLREEIFAIDKSMKSHFHDGQRIVSLYLAFRFPDKYAIYKYTEFKTFMEIVRATNIPKTGEYERFFKVVRTLYAILIKDEELMRLYSALLTDDCFKGETLMLAQDFIFRIARQRM
jgi:5-methylcytosine-specific restriction protein B